MALQITEVSAWPMNKRIVYTDEAFGVLEKMKTPFINPVQDLSFDVLSAGFFDYRGRVRKISQVHKPPSNNLIRSRR